MPPTPFRKATTERTCSHLLPDSIHELGQTPSTQGQFWILLNLQPQLPLQRPNRLLERAHPLDRALRFPLPHSFIKETDLEKSNDLSKVVQTRMGPQHLWDVRISPRPSSCDHKATMFVSQVHPFLCLYDSLCVGPQLDTQDPSPNPTGKTPNPHPIPTSAGGTR